MSLPHRWIIGRGLLGNAIARSRADLPHTVPISWSDAARSSEDLAAGLKEFMQTAGPLEIYWCAGRGVTSTSREALDIEVGVFCSFVDAVAALDTPDRQRVQFFLASSVGGAYAASPSPPFSESTAVAPGSEYGHAKLRMEHHLALATERAGWKTFIARVTNLYGPGQDMSKGQGLISTVVAGSVTNRPVSVYVSLDTLRDYIYEDDCGAVISAAMARLEGEAEGTVVTKIVGSMNAVSVGAILAESTRVRRRRSPLVVGQGSSRGQALDLRVRSEVWTDLDSLASTTLPEGLHAVFQSQLSEWIEGRATIL